MSKLSIIIPTYNESGNIESLVSQITQALRGIEYEVIFVDDSTDNTPEVIRSIMEEDSHIQLNHRTSEKGLATAVLSGFEIAGGDYIAVMDADLQHPPAILRPMYFAMEEGADFCIPSRYIPGGSDGGLNWYRKFVSGTARYIGKILLPCLRKITDPTSGLFMFRKKCIQSEECKMQPIGWKIMIEVLAMADYKTVIEIPYTFQNRENGESKLSAKVTLEYLKQVFELISRGKKHRDTVVSKWTLEKCRELYKG